MEAIQDRGETDLGEYLSILRRRWMLIVGIGLVAVVIVVGLDLRSPKIYSTSAQLLLQPTQAESIFSVPTQAIDATRAVQNELKIINSKAVQAAVAKAYGKPISISAASGGEDDVIILSATDTNPREAARKVNVYAEAYQTERLNTIVADLARSRTVVQNQIDDFQKEIDKLTAPVAALDKQILAIQNTSDPRYNQLVSERQQLSDSISAQKNDLESQLSDYQQRLQILQLSERMTTTGGVQILNPARVPTSPISPTPVRDGLQAGLIGLLVGVALAFMLQQLDDSVRTTADLERAGRPLPVVGLIPADLEWKHRTEERVTTLESPLSATAEAYRGLRTTLQYLALKQPIGVIQMTSCSSSEGKSSTLANLAVAFAGAGTRVAIVGCDLRKPRIHRFFGVDGSIGLTSVLIGERTLRQALQTSPLHRNIDVLASGPRPPNPSELLSLDSTAQIIRSLLDDHDVVFVDSPPVLPVTDALVLSRCVDASMFIAMAGRTSKRQIRRSVERLRQVNSPLIGTILNGVQAEAAYGSLYEYYGYNDTPRPSIFRRPFRKQRVTDTPLLGEHQTGDAVEDPEPEPVGSSSSAPWQ
jgi:capsular exopolysaccharide synthesis family protein